MCEAHPAVRSSSQSGALHDTGTEAGFLVSPSPEKTMGVIQYASTTPFI